MFPDNLLHPAVAAAACVIWAGARVDCAEVHGMPAGAFAQTVLAPAHQNTHTVSHDWYSVLALQSSLQAWDVCWYRITVLRRL